MSKSVYLKIVQSFPWAVISQSVHRILAHGTDRIEINGGFGLGDISEERLESLNRWIGKTDDGGARADSSLHRFTYIYNHLKDRSRKTIVYLPDNLKYT